MVQRCSRCDAPIPADGRFCVECGQPSGQPATGATQRIATADQGVMCGVCGTLNPGHARFCVQCGQALAGAAPVGGTGLAPPLPAPPPLPGLAPLPEPGAPGAPAPLLMAGSGGLFLIGLGVLAVFDWWWPGILVLVGLMALVGSAGAGQPRAGLYGALFMLGLALIAAFGWWWPGILFLVGIMALLSPLLNGAGRRR